MLIFWYLCKMQISKYYEDEAGGVTAVYFEGTRARGKRDQSITENFANSETFKINNKEY